MTIKTVSKNTSGLLEAEVTWRDADKGNWRSATFPVEILELANVEPTSVPTGDLSIATNIFAGDEP